jgi:hypothetical protein
MNISKLRPRFASGKVLGLVVAILASGCAYNYENGNGKERQENRPLHPDRLALVNEQLWKQINNGDPQAVDGVKECAEENKYLEQPVLVNVIQELSNVPAQERCQDMHRYENCHAQPADPMQDKGQHRTLAPVPQARSQADISIQAHLRLLEKLIWERWCIIPSRCFLIKVTILMGYWFQISSNKDGIDPYNP